MPKRLKPIVIVPNEGIFLEKLKNLEIEYFIIPFRGWWYHKFQIKLLSKGGRKIYLSNQNLKTDIFCFFILTNNIEKSYLNSFEKETKLSGELVAKIFI